MMKNTTTIEFKPLAAATGNRAEALNVRRRGEWMEVVGEAAAVCPKTADDVFLGADTRGSRTYFFMQRSHRMVRVAGYSHNGTFVAMDQELIDGGGDIGGFAVSGEFVVLSTPKGLRYLHFNGSSYDSLGGSVEMPVFAIGTTEVAVISTDIPGVTLKSSYRQWKGTLTATDSSGVERTFLSAVSQIQRSAEAGGCSLQPVALRVALRLWDDSRLWSDAVSCVGAVWQPEAVAEVTAGDAWTVEQTSLSASMWQPTLRLVSAGVGEWRPFVKSVEIYATEERQTFDVIRLRCEQSQSGQKGNYLRMRAEVDADALLRRAAEARNMRLVASVTDIDALLDGRIAGNGVTDLGGGVSRVEMLRAEASAEWKQAPAQFTARMFSSVGTSLFAGNLVSRLPDAPHFLSLADATNLNTGVASTFVSVEVATVKGRMVVARSALLECYSLRTTNLVAYPDNRAVKMTIIVVAGGQRYSRDISLAPAHDGNYAYAFSQGGFQLQPSAATDVPASTALTFDQPTALLCSNGNPLLWTACDNADNTGVVGVLPTMRYGSSWVVGRSPVCLFSTDGIRLLSFDTKGRCTASTRISRRVVTDVRLATVTDDGIAFIDSGGQLCRYTNQRVVPTDVTVDRAEGLLYSQRYGELLVYGGSRTIAVAADNSFTHRSATFQSHAGGMAYGHSYVYDVNSETAGTMAVELRTPQLALPFKLRLAEWRIDSVDADICAVVYGENGYSCHGAEVCKMRLRGPLLSTVRQRVAACRVASVRLAVRGSLPTGSRICRIKLS